ncbi:MAG: branched-chain amino acid transport system ATP-binding protein [Thermoleophilaceae bacterium]|jgi:ABC-type branched-subunit amino acid transport system ATPase component|nr:branched-chain amino acid transport system ATP-binding protein [Thermoleophilaceae bacterium]MEA2400707.1 branched-chain amino acid transport system ATP-binding protein [Thermoleophilaceae bacterium]
MTLLAVDDLVSGYGMPVLHGVSLTVDEGELVALLGPNGAGKTTLTKAICRLLPLERGSVQLRGEDLAEAKAHALPRLGVGYVPQEGNVFRPLTVVENLEVSYAGGDRGKVNERIDEVLEFFPRLAQRRSQRARTLSGGERQMLALASALVLSPQLLILDEPTSGLAPSLVKQLAEHIAAVRDSGTAILWVVGEHTGEIVKHADRAYMLDSGVITHQWDERGAITDEVLQEALFSSREPHLDEVP